MSTTDNMYPVDDENNQADVPTEAGEVDSYADKGSSVSEKSDENGKKSRTNFNNLWPKIICILLLRTGCSLPP